MHPVLKPVFEKSVEMFSRDLRVVCLWIEGSECRGMGDRYGDCDVVVLVKDECFQEFCGNLPEMFSKIYPYELLWWPENFNNDEIKNFALLLDNETIIQYDITIIKESQFPSHWFFTNWNTWVLLLDKKNITEGKLNSRIQNKYSPDCLMHTIEEYWLWMFIHVKYFWRKDIFKLINAQNMLFNAHLKVLHSLNPDVEWYFWPITMKVHLDEEKQSQILRYFGAATPETVQDAVLKEMDWFSLDANKACRKWNIQYPYNLEKKIKQYVIEQLSLIQSK